MTVESLVRSLLKAKVAVLVSWIECGDSIEYVFEAHLPWVPCGNRSVRSRLIVPAATGFATDAQIELLLRQIWQGQIEVSELRQLAAPAA